MACKTTISSNRARETPARPLEAASVHRLFHERRLGEPLEKRALVAAVRTFQKSTGTVKRSPVNVGLGPTGLPGPTRTTIDLGVGAQGNHHHLNHPSGMPGGEIAGELGGFSRLQASTRLLRSSLGHTGNHRDAERPVASSAQRSRPLGIEQQGGISRSTPRARPFFGDRRKKVDSGLPAWSRVPRLCS
jgi:hypothetical protein